MEWSALAVSLLVAIALRVWWNHRITWWELGGGFVLSLILIIIGKVGGERLQVSDTEYWTGWVTRADYDDEDTYTVTVTDEDGNVRTETRTDPPSWWVTDNNGLTVSISRSKYKWFVNHFGNESGWADHHTVYKGSRAKKVPLTTVHTYENRTQVSKNVFDFGEVSDSYSLFDYPPVGGGFLGIGGSSHFKVPSILGDGGPTMASANKELCLRNAELGKQKQIRMWILIFKNQPLQAAIEQRNSWKNGNKNELTLCIGVDNSYKVQWANVFSWTEEERLKIDIRNFVLEQDTLDLNEVVAYMGNESQRRWVRKEFADFRYLSVPLPLWTVLTIVGVVTAFNFGWAFFAIFNQHAPGRRREAFRPRWRKSRYHFRR